MGLFSGWKPKTIAGKILKGVVSIGVPVAAAVTGVGAVAGVIGGAGALAGAAGAAAKVAGVLKSGVTAVVKTGGAVATRAADMVSGTTKEQREMIQDQKAETKADLTKLTTIQKLINAGATVKEAAAKVGVPLAELAGLFGLPSESDQIMASEAVVKDTSGTVPLDKNKMIMYTGIGLAALLLLPKLMKGR